MKKEKLLLIDGSNLVIKSYYSAKKIQQSGLCVFMRNFLRIVRDLQPTHLCICWDTVGKTFRHDIFPAYKKNRTPKDREVTQLFHDVQLILDIMNVYQSYEEKYEADDLIGTYITLFSKSIDCYIYSNDKDMYSLLNKRASIVNYNKSILYCYTHEVFKNQYSILPEQWIEVKALMGDQSDNVAGVPGIGEKGALELIRYYNNLFNIYENIAQLDKSFNRYRETLIVNKREAFLAKTILSIVTNFPSLKKHTLSKFKLNVNKRSMIEAFREFNLYTLLTELKQGVYRVS